jgi:hypothetical protein
MKEVLLRGDLFGALHLIEPIGLVDLNASHGVDQGLHPARVAAIPKDLRAAPQLVERLALGPEEPALLKHVGAKHLLATAVELFAKRVFDTGGRHWET